MTRYYRCPTCNTIETVVGNRDGMVIIECPDHGVRSVSADEIWQEAPGQQSLNLFGS